MKKLSPKWNFNQLLKQEMVTVNQLYKQLENEVSRTGLYNWSKKRPKSLNLEHAGVILSGLSAITGKEYAISDLLSYEIIDPPKVLKTIVEEQAAYQAINDEAFAKIEPYDWGDFDPEGLGEELQFVDGEWQSGQK